MIILTVQLCKPVYKQDGFPQDQDRGFHAQKAPSANSSNTITSYTHHCLRSLGTHFSRSSTLGQWIPTVGSLLCLTAFSNTVGGATCTEPESCHNGVFHAASQQ